MALASASDLPRCCFVSIEHLLGLSFSNRHWYHDNHPVANTKYLNFFEINI